MIGSPTVLRRVQSAPNAAVDTGSIHLRGATHVLVLVGYAPVLSAGHIITISDPDTGDSLALLNLLNDGNEMAIAAVLGPGLPELVAAGLVPAQGSRVPDSGTPSFNGYPHRLPQSIRVQSSGGAGAGVVTTVVVVAVID